jgi:hypothetical protein
MNSTIGAALIAAGGVLITAMLTFYLWWRDTQRRRAKDLEISTALYINPFIDACEQLQSRLYNVFQLQGLIALKKQYENGKHAYEMVFQLARYCGWERIVRRYASHTLDQATVNLLEEVRAAFSSSSDDKWRFYREEQKTLGQFAVRRVSGAEHEFEEVPFYQFESELKSGALAEMTSTHFAISSICGAGDDPKKIDGKERLKLAQTKLVKILNRLETAVNYSVFKGRRKSLI